MANVNFAKEGGGGKTTWKVAVQLKADGTFTGTAYYDYDDDNGYGFTEDRTDAGTYAMADRKPFPDTFATRDGPPCNVVLTFTNSVDKGNADTVPTRPVPCTVKSNHLMGYPFGDPREGSCRKRLGFRECVIRNV